MTNEEVRQKVISVFHSGYSLSYDTNYPGEGAVDLESRSDPVLMISVKFGPSSQVEGRSRAINKTGGLYVAVHTLANTGDKVLTSVLDYLETLSVRRVDDIVYDTPAVVGEVTFKGWDIVDIVLPFFTHSNKIIGTDCL